jgi:hypothetical protein
MADNEKGNALEFRGTFLVAAVNSAQGFLERALVCRTQEQAIASLDGAQQWITRAQRAIEGGKLPDGFDAPKLRPAGPKLPLEPLDTDEGGA